MKRCLYCYQELDKENAGELHARCSKEFFGTVVIPELSLEEEDIEKYATEIVKKHGTIPGVQPKLSLSIQKDPKDPKKSRLTLVGLWGDYILKPQTKDFPSLPENEDLSMKLAALAGIKTASHSLIRTTSGKLAYITKRFDRLKDKKVPVEDLCQLGELPSSGNSKYNSSMERAGKTILQYSSAPLFDAIIFFEITVFGFLTSNADMHLKNFSILRDNENQYRIAPAYDLVCTPLAKPEDKEQMALTLNGKRNNIRNKDFYELADRLTIKHLTVQRTIERQLAKKKEWEALIAISFLSEEMKERYIALIASRMKKVVY
ncbi:MAG: HipA domain-containing protein [Chryseolinea sp.]